MKKKIKDMARKLGKKIGEKAFKKINGLLEEKAEEIIRKAGRQAAFSGRKVIKEEDIAD